MKLAIALSLVLFGAACKTDNAASSEANSESAGATESDLKGRSAKIEPGPHRGRPSMNSEQEDEEEPTDEDREARREERREDRRKERMEALDKDGNGQLSPEEIALGRKQRTEEMRLRMDGDGDGRVSVEELSLGRMGRRIDAATVDTDKNGDISAEELQAGMQKMREQMRAQRGADGPTGGWGGGRWGGGPRGERGAGAGSATPKVQ